MTLICQGLAGGQGRMQSEFLAAPAPTVWLLTPWMFEGIELPPGSVDHLLIKSLPFDHPANPVLSRRSGRYADGFKEYAVPRLLHRLFRVLRTYARFAKPEGDVRLMDERLFSKAYGKRVREYLSRFALPGSGNASGGSASFTSAKVGGAPAKKAAKPKQPPAPPTDQLPLF